MKSLHPSVLALILSAPLFTFFSGDALATQENDFEKAKERYENYLQRLPFLMHTRGRKAFAKSRHIEALKVLVASYPKASQPREQSQYLIAGFATQYCNMAEHVDILDTWRKKNSKSKDAWLWYRALSVHGKHRGPEVLLEIARDHKDIFMRAAAVEALAFNRDETLRDLIPEFVGAMPKKEEEKAVMTAALAKALASTKQRRSTPEFRRAAVAFSHLLDDEAELSFSSKLIVARHLKQLFGGEILAFDSRTWIALISGTARKADPADIYVRPKFFGIEASGDRICYVIDMSDSMCKPITFEGKPKPKGPMSGPNKKKKKGELPTVDDIPWHLVETRFDLAREHLKISLRQLNKEQHFSVIFFGTEADLMKPCTGMVKATNANVKKMIKALDGIDVGSATARRPDGVLRGLTNLHGGIRRAFMVKKKGFVDEHEYVNMDAIEEGPNTIFVLSDGMPSWDDWDAKDKNYHEDRIGDPETHEPLPDADNLHYHGPYVDIENLVTDVRRMNMFREIEINCIGIGEAHAGLLQQLARVGMGQMQRVGK